MELLAGYLTATVLFAALVAASRLRTMAAAI
jgi:hypothetical protein